MIRMRADQLLVTRGLAESRAKARATIEAGGVRSNGAPVRRPAELLDENALLEVERPHPWVSRGGLKLAAALDAFAVDPNGRICLDVGASTGGFTQVLLSRSASRVYALDVGRDQLHASLRADVRVVNLERTDARVLTSAMLPASPSLVVCDASFIGAAKVLRVPLSLAAERADLVVLIKPQFEAGPGKGGVLNEQDARAAAEAAISALEGMERFVLVASADSAIRGGDGNLEIFAHFRR